MRQILCVSTSNYNPFPTRKQNVMNRLSHAEILYFDPPVSLIAPLKDKAALPRLFAFRKSGEKVRENITVYAMPPVLPFFNQHRWINRINQFVLARYVQRRMKERGFQGPYIWCYSPTSCDLISHIPNQGVIYDCVDRHSAYKGRIAPEVVDRMEEDLARSSAQVFCTAQGLYETLSGYNKNTKLIPNGAAYEIFSRAQDDFAVEKRAEAAAQEDCRAESCAEAAAQGDCRTESCAEAAAQEDCRAESCAEAAAQEESRAEPCAGEAPVFGFVGMLQDCIDYDCIMALAEAFPQGKVVLIGKPLPGVDVSPLEKYPNIRFKGLIPQNELPDHIREFHVCINVFRKGRLSRDVSPLKFYEYLATGKPIVSTEEPLQVLDYADVVYIAENPSDFVVKCKEALMESDPEKRKKRIAYGKACSWDQRVKDMENTLIENSVWR